MALSGKAEGTVTYNSGGYTFYVDWTAVQSVEGNYSDVTTYMRISNSNPVKYKFQTDTPRPIHIDIDGNRVDWSRTYQCNPWPGNPFTIDNRTVRIPHNPNGTKTFYIEAGLTINIVFNGMQIGLGNCNCEKQYFDLDPIPRTPSAPPYLTADMRRDGSILLSWGASSGYVTGYDLEYLYSDPNTNAYSSWIPLASTTSTSYIDGSEKWAAGTGFTYQVRARNGTLASNWTYTGWVYRKGGLYVNSGGERKFGTVYAPGTPPLKAKGVFIGNANGTPIESIRITSERT